MSHHFRRFLLFLIIIIFLIGSPLIILYARGYRFNLQTLEFTKTGTISIKTIPRGAAIYLDNKLYKDASPSKIDSLKPNNYELKIEKQGFEPWKTNLTVKPELVTSATHIILFAQNLPEQILLQDKINNFSLSPDNKKIIYNLTEGENRGIWLNEKNKGKNIKLSDIYFDEFNWSSDNKKVLLSRKEEDHERYGLLDLSEIKTKQDQIKIWEIGSLFKEEIKSVQWQPTNSQKLFLLSENNLYEVDILKSEISLLFKNIYSYLPTSWGSILVQKREVGYFLISKNYLWQERSKIISRLPEADQYKIILGSKKIAVIAENNLYLIDQELPLKIASEVQGASWSPDGKRLLYFNEHQIEIYYLREEEKTLLTRDSRELQNVGWWPRSQYVVFTVEGKLKFIDGAKEMNTHHITEIKNTELPETRINWSKNTKQILYLRKGNQNTNALVEVELIKD